MFRLEDRSCKVCVNFPPAGLLIKEPALWNSCEFILFFAFKHIRSVPKLLGLEQRVLYWLKWDCDVFPILSKNILAGFILFFFFLSRTLYFLFSTWIVLVYEPPVCMQAVFEWVQASQIITSYIVLMFWQYSRIHHRDEIMSTWETKLNHNGSLSIEVGMDVVDSVLMKWKALRQFPFFFTLSHPRNVIAEAAEMWQRQRANGWFTLHFIL